MREIIKRLMGLTVLGGILCPPGLAAQDSSGSWRDFDCVRGSEVWLTGYNASGLFRLPEAVQRISFAQVSAIKNNGDFVNFYQSNNSYTFGAQTESFYRMSPKVVVYGKMEYRNFTGQNMGGAAFIDPYYHLFNFIEVSQKNTGEKNFERYHLVGAVGARITSRFSMGAKIDYLAANYTKHKDLRHENNMLDLTATAGAAFSLNVLDLGVNYIYRRSVESIKFQRFGTTDLLYSNLIDFGAFYGRTQLFGESGYTRTEKTPVFNQFQGVALQLKWNIRSNLTLFNEFSYLLRSGYYGNASAGNNLICYSEHDGNEMAYSGVVSLSQNQNQHLLSLNFRQEQLSNFENIYRRENDPEAGRTTIVYYGNNKVLDRTRMTAGIEYTGRLQIEDYCPKWEFKAGGNYTNRAQTVSLFPYYRKQDIFFWNAYLKADRRITVRKNQYGMALGLLYGAGGGNMNTDGLYATPSEDSRQPYSSEYHLQNEYEYLTAGRVTINMGVSYARMIRPKVRGYVRLVYEFTNALQVEHLAGSQFHGVQLSVGCGF